MKKKILAASSIAMAGALLLAGCSSVLSQNSVNSIQQQGQQDTVDAFGKQSAAVPYPKDQLSDSLERRNLRERLLRTNKPDALGYIYLMSFGKVIGYYTVKGKVSAVDSQMTTDTLLVDCGGGNGNWSKCPIPAPGDDGSYGTNEGGSRGIFFFTTSGQFVETTLDWVWADAPLPIDVPKFG